MSKRFIVALTLLLTTSSAWSVMHIHPGVYPHAAQDQIHHPSALQIRRAGSLRAAMNATSKGPQKIAVLLVQFQPSAPGVTSGGYLLTTSSLSAIDNFYVEQKQYYFEVSYSTLTLNFTFFGANGVQTTAAASGAYTLPHPMEWYGCGDEGTGCASNIPTPTSPEVSPNGDYLIHDALMAADASLTSANYDAVIVMHAGNGNETTEGTPGDIWSIFYSQDSIIQSAGRNFDEGDVVPATEALGYSPLGVMCHEFGHSLGLPDLYNTTSLGGTSVVGDWELMDSGPYDGFGANPAHMGAWDKIQLGWIQPSIEVSTNSSVSLSDVETTPAVIKLPVQNGAASEYFLAEYRWRSSGALFDRDIPGDGLLIWHIDDSIAQTRGINAPNPSIANTVNSGSPHYGVSIVPADGSNLPGQGDRGNPFQNGSFFSSPKSDNFENQPSGINLVNIAGIGTPTLMTDAVNLTVGANQSILKLISYPNPAGKNYPHPSGPNHATIQFQLSRPANDYNLNIYTLSANLVRKISQSEITLVAKRLENDKWVYEYVWDLKNGDGSMVAPGVYFYTVHADGETGRGKLVVIR